MIVGALDGTTILLVDDDPLIRRALGRGMQRAGAEVLDAGSVADARELLNESIDVLITDIDLGPESGVTLARETVRRLPLVLVFAITGQATLDQAFELGRAGVETILLKPITVDQLVLAVSAAEAPSDEHLDRIVRRMVGSATLNDVLDRVRRSMVGEALARTDQTKAHAAAELGISRQHLQKLLERGQA